VTRHYLDHASTSPLRPEAVEAMLPWLGGTVAADPSRVHTEGRLARAAIEHAREQVAALVGARPREVVFTGGATEAIATAVWGVASRGPHQVVSAVEHSAVLESAGRHDTTVVGVDRAGMVDADAVVDAIRPEQTAAVHLQWGNHEVGTLQPVAEVVAACRQRGVLVHVDAAAAAGHVPIDFEGLGTDLLSLSAHKLGGPQGVGALVIRRGLRLPPLLVGGEQERSRRAGTENVAGIVGFGAAAVAVAQHLHSEATAARGFTDVALAAATSLDGVVSYGDPVDRLPHIVCFGVTGVEAEAVLLGLDQAGIAAHSGSACSSESLEPSPVLRAMGVEAERSLRVSVGWSTTVDDIDAFCEALPGVVDRLRALATTERGQRGEATA
jgi:cysteine desulfurase